MCDCVCVFVKHEHLDNNSGKRSYYPEDPLSVRKFFLTNSNICKAVCGPKESFPIKRSAYPKGQIVNIRCTFKIKSPRNSEIRSGKFPNGV